MVGTGRQCPQLLALLQASMECVWHRAGPLEALPRDPGAAELCALLRLPWISAASGESLAEEWAALGGMLRKKSPGSGILTLWTGAGAAVEGFQMPPPAL